VVSQGDIIWLEFSPHAGHEQAGRRPALVVSNDILLSRTKFAVVCPITNTKRPHPLHIELDGRTATTGVVLCEQLKSVDLESRGYVFIEKTPDDLLDAVIEIVQAELEKN
jgi:mRNA interferase MazF